MKKQQIIIVLILGFIIPVHVFGQKFNPSKIMEKPNAIFFAPLNLIDPINPSLQIGYERMLSPKWALQAEVGYIINKALFFLLTKPEEKSDEFTNKGYKLRLELKRTLLSTKIIMMYTSCELHYLKNVSDVVGQFLISDPNYIYSFGQSPNKNEAYYYSDYYTNDKTKYGVNIKCGVKVFDGPIFLETYLGIGVANRNNIHTNRENINDESIIQESFLNSNLKGQQIILNIPLNLKVGYRF